MSGGKQPTTVFINHRRSNSMGWARVIYDRLVPEFGAENVFLDEASILPGAKWMRDIRERSEGCTAFLAVIGPGWASTMSERAKGSEEDFVRTEIEAALRRDSGVRAVIPVLIAGAVIPEEADLPYLGSVHPLLKRQQLELRPASLDPDAGALIERLKAVAAAEPEVAAAARPPAPEVKAGRREPAETVAPRPDRDHYDEVVRQLLDEGSVLVPFLGPGANSSDRTEPWENGDSGFAPDSDELAGYLALKLGSEEGEADLAKISQSVSVAKGPGDLYMALRRALPPRCPPGSVHRFLAGLPSSLAGLGFADRYQVIVTTNYDDALERAFEEAEEPYDLAIYVARGRDKGRFVHVPHDGEPVVIADANGYAGFPIDAFGRVERTVIMKVHGAAIDPAGGLRDNYVITEDDYIDYMSAGNIESIVPQQLLGQLRDYSHFLFLGHEMRDWNLRVFLIRIFGERQQPNTSWAIQREPDRLDERFWQRMGVELAAIPLDEYVRELGQDLTRAAGGDPAQA